MCHCCMNSEEFEDEYDYFYDFAPTYEENFVGKKIDDFDLSEEPLAKPLSDKIFSQIQNKEEKVEEEMKIEAKPMEEITEEDGDGDWEDVDVEDGEEEKVESSTGSFQKISGAPSSSDFTLIDHSKAQESSSNPELNAETKSLAEQSNLSEAEVVKLLERRKQNRFGKF